MAPIGYLSLVLHAHLPFVRHPEYPSFLEEDWLFEAMGETYIPLLRMMNRLERDGIRFRLTMSMTPPLCEMLADPLLQDRFAARLAKLLELAQKEAENRKGTPFHDAASFCAEDLRETRELFEQRWHRQVLPVFKRFQDQGSLELITCGATHGFLPLMSDDVARRAQIEVAVRNYEKHFGRAPRGIWLPECAYAPGLDFILRDAGIKFTILETHGLTDATPPARFGPYRPVVSPSGTMVFGRDPEVSRQVWSAESGYPGDPHYREFYRDLGYDLPYDAVKDYLHGDGVRRNIGLKFHRITGKVSLDAKEPYVPSWALERAEQHAQNFLDNRLMQARHLSGAMGTRPHVTAPYDAELFGHWWFEGPHFIEMIMRKAACDQGEVELCTPSEYLDVETVHQQVQPALSSWGAEGYFGVWLNHTNDWVYRHLHHAEQRMMELAERFPNADGILQRALNQAARELLLAQSSDWAFIMAAGTMVEYAVKRTRDHIANFTGLYLQIVENRLEPNWLGELEWKNSIFQELDYRVYHPQGSGARRGSAVFSVS
ncbi:MAG: glycoside hydrolase [Deltaproteobacteria bacterium CG2_30_63_29]|nr:MAG: glycoside hydrolase [Deltaproteobacteria bacterium CG2_30_63_29]